jgi:hypothetical protein
MTKETFLNKANFVLITKTYKGKENYTLIAKTYCSVKRFVLIEHIDGKDKSTGTVPRSNQSQ